jgi:hypothetical protein
MQSNGFISPFDEIPSEVQSEYLVILKDFEKNTSPDNLANGAIAGRIS